MKISAALEDLGMTQRALADAIGRHESTVSRIISGAEKPSHIAARAIHAATKKKVKLHELRPDIWDAP